MSDNVWLFKSLRLPLVTRQYIAGNVSNSPTWLIWEVEHLVKAVIRRCSREYFATLRAEFWQDSFSSPKATSGTQRSWATTASSSTKSKSRPGTAARRERCTASPSALTSSPSANPAGKVSLHLLKELQAGWSVSRFSTQRRRWDYLCVIYSSLYSVCVCARARIYCVAVLFSGPLRRRCDYLHLITSACLISLTSKCRVLNVVCTPHLLSTPPLCLPSAFLHRSVSFPSFSWRSFSLPRSQRNWLVRCTWCDQLHFA